MSISIWAQSYSAWYRSRRQQAGTAGANAMTTAYAGNPGTLRGLSVQSEGNPQPKDGVKDKKIPDSLFGPNIGVISGGPSWTVATEKKVLKDELTMDIVKTWIEKSKEPSQPTTTLQALVNLKRPTLRLSPLALDLEHPDESHSQHALEFEYDCDAPKCGIYVHVLVPPRHPEALSMSSDNIEPSVDSASNIPSKPRHSKVLVFESVVEGGFGRALNLEEGAVLELGRFEMHKAPAVDTAGKQKGQDMSEQAGFGGNVLEAGRQHNRRRITHLFRRRRNGVSVSGPALAVVDASSPPVGNDGTNNEDSNIAKEKKKDDADQGVKVTIRLVALDEQGTELASPNEQVTYLCVERFGTRLATEKKTKSKTEASENSEQQEGPSLGEGKEREARINVEDDSVEEDTRPWVVKVVKREATIGPHVFQLHEIYGLTSSSSHAPAPTAPLPTPPHTYPPQQSTVPVDTSDDITSECLLCLSSPREVVLLPCRHLVACKECALNMVEFGAGGAITQGTSGEEAPNVDGTSTNHGVTEGTTEGATAGGNAENTTGAGTTTATTNPRRKRKAKGWFCPVCRQPYTSLLRITTNPPPVPTSAKEERSSHSQDEEQDITDNTETNGPGLPLPATTSTTPGGSGAGLLSRPSEFFRSLTSRGGQNPNVNAASQNAGRRDLENQL
ncbi:hypothetical protein E1B28_006216 [Marasmius oreades]|uniref:RING-type domain-containing protein n=1 Tax=Marasmius oreades TaxID=181124 RepID=A0A9P7UV22_9AGAR|nr:uncharacterized protein E1B28_006216 [Marasmius oreades]KAG7095477.1 hypothetical protein E1B28_006216 [Marasmius oreades]